MCLTPLFADSRIFSVHSAKVMCQAKNIQFGVNWSWEKREETCEANHLAVSKETLVLRTIYQSILRLLRR